MKFANYVLSLLLLPATVLAAPTVTDAWIAEAPPVSTVMAAFMRVHNPDANQVKIVGVQSDQFSDVQMHLSKEENGIARMLPQKNLVVPARGDLVLQQGGYHLMMFNPVSPLVAGNKVTLNITFADGSQLLVVAEVKKLGAEKSKAEHMQMKKDGSHRCY